MFRVGSYSLFGMALLVVTFSTAANPPDNSDTRIKKNLEVQSAMYHARNLLLQGNGQKAVEILEDQLAKINGNVEYLTLLRSAYRIYIQDLYLAGKSDLAQRYVDRLCILEPGAASDPSLRPSAETPPRKFEPEPPKQEPVKQVGTGFPRFQMPKLFGKKEEPKSGPPAKPSVVRGRAEDSTIEDPFDQKNMRPVTQGSNNSGNKAQEYLARGADEFSRQRYGEARLSFEQAFKADQNSLSVYQEQWAYCIIKGVSDQLDQPGNMQEKLPDLQRQIEEALRMAPSNPKMTAKGQELLQRLGQQAKGAPTSAPQVFVSATKIKHLGANREGWQVAETAHFRIFHRQNNEFATQVAQIAEDTRTKMYRKWFNTDDTPWQPICELIVHPTGTSYSEMTGVPTSSPGHSRIESDSSGRVVSRRMDLRADQGGMMTAILPHETTHVVLAGMFGAKPVPRWVDEGIAVLAEPDDKIDHHRRDLLKHHHEQHLFGLRELMELADYPHPRRIGAFYAQSVVLVEFLTKRSGAKVFTEFVQDGLRHGYETALKRHYQLTFAQLDQQWQQQVLNDTERYSARK